ncbi:helix-turn-helix transcriptional regulator [Trinickia caryophylli]|uniref:AraC-type DNA-binding protein n=2 Tax=Trinickia caryophylli TaxID=28094 RepID=A0A1X7EUV0_TRICW|nr:helix-turn-helix transcriptional regulator [Trinickia caryophylli]PMS12190.1 AraC family transcriptional regulator [Trinickia caryophylli]TRX18501.1 helix-turn-helix transcriptional regulator [Trinickia caryophylli]WQE10710.1 helix-turn-helix transcriptional regulator [Trinickia caryophylli]SMF40675.1 AraC-type DNA-binding protein [Trinickia caryophylli]
MRLDDLTLDLLNDKLGRIHDMTEPDPPLIAVMGRQSQGRESPPHTHQSGQLLGLFSGLLTVWTDTSAWIVPATHAIWIPPEHVHAARSHGPFEGWAVYVAQPHCAGRLPNRPQALEVPALLREAIVRAARWEWGPLEPRQARLAGVILDEIADAQADALSLPMPRDTRLVRIATALADDPANARTLEQWAGWAGMAPRTLSRRFTAETGVSFMVWRQRARLMRALELLAAGHSVTSVSLDLGYESVGAFIALFRRTFGTTPGRYFAVHLPLKEG